MTCLNCQRTNLPGGLRCAYCGAYLPTALEFDLGQAPETSAPAPALANSLAGTTGDTSKAVKTAGALAPLAVLLLKLKSLLAFLKFGKILLTLSSMLLSITVYAQMFGWKFAVGAVVSIFIHEMGHVFVNWRYKLPQSAPVFIPLMGAAIFLKKFPDNPQIQAESGAGGPVAGFLAALGCYGIYFVTHDHYWLALAEFGFWINLFNLVPLPYLSLDGAHIHTVFSPGVWNASIVVMLLWALKFPSPLLWLILIVSFLSRLGYKDDGRYLLASPRVRARMAVLFLAMAVGMSWVSDRASAELKSYRSHRSGVSSPTAGDAPRENIESRNPSQPLANTDEDTADPREGATTLRWLSEAATPDNPVLWAVALLIVMISVGLWCGAIGCLISTQKRAWTPADGLFLGGMLAILPLTFGAMVALPLDLLGKLSLLGAYLAGTVVAFGYAAVAALRGGFKGQIDPPTPIALRMRLATAFGIGVFIVGYVTNSLAVLGALGVGVAVFYLIHRWMAHAAVAGLLAQIGDTEKTITALERAAISCPDIEERAHLWGTVAYRNSGLYRGAASLTARQRQEEAVLSAGQIERTTLSLISEWEDRATASGLTDHYDEGLACCEQTLRTASQDPYRAATLVPIAEAYVHIVLARFALWRGWYDEAVAQADWCLKRLGPTSLQYRGVLLALKAEALLGQAGMATEPESRATFLNQAETTCAAAEKQSHDNGTRAYVAVVRTQIALQAGDKPGATVAAKRALDLLPGHLVCLYWYGRVVDPNMLSRLAAEFPNDHWGRLAALEQA